MQGGREQAFHRLLHAEAVTILRLSGIDAVVLKGPAVVDWLYSQDPDTRPAGDIDLLVPVRDIRRAEQALIGRYCLSYPGLRPSEWTDRSKSYVRADASTSVHLDLHVNFHGIAAPADVCFAEIWGGRVEALLGGVRVWFPGLTMRALLVVLHAAQDGGRSRKTAEDLNRLLVHEDIVCEAALLAKRLRAGPAFAAGLMTSTDAQALARRHGLPLATTARWRLATERGPRPRLAVRLAELPRRSPATLLKILLSEFWPSRASLAYGYPYANRGSGWAGLARLHRLVRLSRALPGAVWALRRAGQDSEGSSPRARK